mgnify:CR=1 FL=1
MSRRYENTYSERKVIASPSYQNEVGSHYVLESTHQNNSGNYVIVLDSGSKNHHQKKHQEFTSSKEVENYAASSSEHIKEKEFWKAKVFEMEKVFELEIETIKETVMNECKTILVFIIKLKK